MIRTFGLAILVVLGAGLSTVAEAKPKVALVEFEDDTAGEMQDLVAEALEGDFKVITSRAVAKTIDKLGYDATDLSEKQLRKIAKELEAGAVIRGDLNKKKKSGHKVLHVMLFVNGKKVRGFRIEFVSAKSQKVKDALKEKLAEKLASVAETDGGGEEEDKKPPKNPPKETGDDDGEDDKKPPKDKDGGDDEDPDKKVRRGDGDEDEDEEPTDGEERGGDGPGVAENPHTINRAAVRVDIGVSLSKRQLAFNSRGFEEAPRGYQNDPVPGARVEADIYPLAFGNPNGIAAGIGVGGEFDQTLSLNLQSTVQPGTKFPVKQNHWSVGARLRFVFGKKATSPSITLKGGLGARQFVVDRSRLEENKIIDLPDVGYKGFVGGADLRFPVARPVAVFAGGNGIFVTTTGAIQTASQYGQAKVTGVDVRAGVDIAIGRRMAIKAFAEFTQMGFAFTGTGQMSNNRDGDPGTTDVFGAADRYLGGSLLFGVLY